jgi:hypothetical protein
VVEVGNHSLEADNKKTIESCKLAFNHSFLLSTPSSLFPSSWRLPGLKALDWRLLKERVGAGREVEMTPSLISYLPLQERLVIIIIVH